MAIFDHLSENISQVFVIALEAIGVSVDGISQQIMLVPY